VLDEVLAEELRGLAVHDVSNDAARRLHAQMLSRHDALRKREERWRFARAAILATTCVTYLTWAIAFTIALR
jgi:hypothetical protein